jgi:hypothetical protein
MVASIAILQVYGEGKEWRVERLRAFSRQSKRVEKRRNALRLLCSVGAFVSAKGLIVSSESWR